MLLKVKNAVFKYGDTTRNAGGIKGVSFGVKRGEILAISGENGSGKSTLIKTIYGLNDLEKGEIIFDGQPVLGPSRVLIPGHKEMKWVSQELEVLPDHTVKENVTRHLHLYFKHEMNAIAQKLMTDFGLKSVQHKKARHVSGGQKQRTLLASALAEKPKLLLLDEPFGQLDVEQLRFTLSALRNIVHELNIAVIIVTHNPKEALSFADKILFLDKGKVVAKGTPQAMFETPSKKRVGEFYGICNWCTEEEVMGITADKKALHEIKGEFLIRPHDLEIESQENGTYCVVDSFYQGENYLIQLKSEWGERWAYSTNSMSSNTMVNLKYRK